MTDIPASGGTCEAPSSPPPNQAAVAPWIAPAIAALIYLLFWQIAPRVRTDSMGAIIISTLFSLGLIVWFTASLARIAPSIRVLLMGALISGALVIPLKVMLGTNHVYLPWTVLLWIPGLADLIF